MKKYKHEQTGVVACLPKNNPDYYYLDDINDICPTNFLHKKFVENTNDWEEIEQKTIQTG